MVVLQLRLLWSCAANGHNSMLLIRHSRRVRPKSLLHFFFFGWICGVVNCEFTRVLILGLFVCSDS